MGWCNHQHRRSGIKFAKPHQGHSEASVEVCRYRACVYEHARKRHQRRWSRSTRCWRQPKVVWINQPPPGIDAQAGTLAMDT
ncbi:InsF-like transposase [Cyanobium sp. NS01]|nr:InsF-like transposase [Cyanobium sp. NS01]